MRAETIQRDSLGRFILGIGYPKNIPKINKICKICKSDYYRWPSQLKAKRDVCSWKCYWIDKKGEKQKHLLTKKGKFKRKIANKISRALTGKPLPLRTNEKHPMWKGKNAGYTADHQWLRRKYGKADKCENPDCKYPRINSNGKIMFEPKIFHWALIHECEHDHDRTHYIKLCCSCHAKYDRNLIEISL